MCMLNIEWMNVSLLFPVPHAPFYQLSTHFLSHSPCPRLPAFRYLLQLTKSSYKIEIILLTEAVVFRLELDFLCWKFSQVGKY